MIYKKINKKIKKKTRAKELLKNYNIKYIYKKLKIKTLLVIFKLNKIKKNNTKNTIILTKKTMLPIKWQLKQK